MRSSILLLAWATLLAGCLPDSRFPDAPDFDGDGFVGEDDCDDADALINPDTVWHADGDGDGFGSIADTQTACEQPSGYLLDATDCDDADQTIHPGAPEVCDGVDQDCNDLVDDNPTDTATYYADVDTDGYGDPETATTACEPPTGFVTNADDCDDDDALVNPDGTEACNGADDDCDGTVDENDAIDVTTWYADVDADTYGDDADTLVACDQPTGYTDRGGDCDDADDAYNPGVIEADCTDPNDYNCDTVVAFVDADSDGHAACVDCDDDDAAVNPAATEVCNGKDDDCSGQVDGDDASDAVTYYKDDDGDGYGVDATTAIACSPPTGYAAAGGDCDDDSVAYNPGVTEDDCSDPEDYNCDGSVAFADVDGDGFAACDECDDTDATIKPTATEMCDGVDNNCDGETDEITASDVKTWYLDSDGDGYGTGTGTVACDAPTADHVDATGDCDDTKTAYNPGATETDCSDPEDYNCDGSVGFVDGDGDGYAACEECDDTSNLNFPGADERCDGVDNDCDSVVDEVSAIDVKTWYVDVDVDGYGDEGTTDTKVQCNKPTGYADNEDDCDDTRKSVNPGASEVCDTADLDEDCDGLADDTDTGGASGKVRYYPDTDGDSYGDKSSAGTQYCDPPTTAVLNKLDCDDTKVAVNPAALEICDTADVDEDCDGLADDLDSAASGKSLYYTDADGDTFGATTSGGTAYCDPPTTGVSTNKTDCNDANVDINPGEVEVCDSLNTDENCNTLSDDADSGATGKLTYYDDDDADTFGDKTDTGTAYCDPPSGSVLTNTDCNDAVAAIKPGATELPADGVDQNCDTQELCYTDADNDGARLATTVVSTDLDCTDANEGVTADPIDCDDTTNTRSPLLTEVAGNDVDEDCNLKATCYTDADNDGARLTTTLESADTDCADANEGVTADPIDCDDSTNTRSPLLTEAAGNDIDEDCNLKATCYTDADNDGARLATTFESADTDCSDANEGLTADPIDCDDSTNTRSPLLTEAAGNDVDEDCNLKATCYTDADNDGARLTTTFESADTDCADANEGVTADLIDCNDGSSAIKPGATELVGDSVDQNCDTKETCYVDADGDGYGALTGTVESTTDTDCADAGEANDNTDCKDTGTGAVAVNPGAAEVCDSSNTDEDCDTFADDADTGGATGKVAIYTDADGDGYGALGSTSTGTECDADANESKTADDCNDNVSGGAAINPAAAEVCDTSNTDEDCDGNADDADTGGATGKVAIYTDTDGDTYGAGTSTGTECDADANESKLATDCDDTASESYPGAPELCDGEQNNCSATWTNDNGIVSYHPTSGTASNVTSSFTGSYSLPTSGTLQICTGTYTTTLTDAGGATTIDILADGLVSVRGFALTNAATDIYALGVDVDNTSAVGLTVSDATLELDGSILDGSGASAFGAASVTTSGSLTLTNSIVANYIGLSAMYVEASTLTLDGTLVTGNTSSGNGGGLYLNGGTATCIGAGTAEGFHANKAGQGGAVYVNAGTFTATTCDFGAGADENTLSDGTTANDIYVATGAIGYTYVDDESFTCSNLICTP